MVSNTELVAIGARSSSRNRNSPQTSTAPVRMNRNGVGSTCRNGPRLRLWATLATLGSRTAAISSRLWRR
jgi:hypothetical protein